MKNLLTENVSSTEQLKEFVSKFNDVITKNAVILLEGDLGAGKTTFVSCFCELYNIAHVQSPTYAVHNRYNNERIAVDHFDLYRLEDEEQIAASGFYDSVNTFSPEFESNYKFIEWSERLDHDTVSSFKNCYRVTIELTGTSQSRRLNLARLS